MPEYPLFGAYRWMHIDSDPTSLERYVAPAPKPEPKPAGKYQSSVAFDYKPPTHVTAGVDRDAVRRAAAEFADGFYTRMEKKASDVFRGVSEDSSPQLIDQKDVCGESTRPLLGCLPCFDYYVNHTVYDVPSIKQAASLALQFPTVVTCVQTRVKRPRISGIDDVKIYYRLSGQWGRRISDDELRCKDQQLHWARSALVDELADGRFVARASRLTGTGCRVFIPNWAEVKIASQTGAPDHDA